jgi:hypothetical protein
VQQAVGLEILRESTVARELLASDIPARLSYVWHDGSPRVVPMWFEWTGRDFVMGAPPNAPKMKVLVDKTPVSLVVDDSTWPYRVLTVQGSVSVERLEDCFPEYEAMARRYLGEEGSRAFLTARAETFAGMGWSRITIRPQQVHLLDFGAGTFPSAWTKGNPH